jgi:hypothetical protein
MSNCCSGLCESKGADGAHTLALEIKLSAERKAGGFLEEMKENVEIRHGGKGRDNNTTLGK